MSRLSVLLLSEGGHVAGSTMSVFSLATHLRERGHEVTVGRTPGLLLDEQLNARGFPRPDLDFTSLQRLTGSLRALLARRAFDIVNPQATRDRRACTMLRWQGALAPALVATRRTMPLTWFPELMAVGYTADATIAVSDAVREGLLRRGHPNRRLHVVRNGIMLDRVDQTPSAAAAAFAANVMEPLESHAVLLTVARRKDQDILLRALPHVSTPVAAVFAGIEMDATLQPLVDALPPRHRAVFLGTVPEPLPLYRYATLVTLPSRIEGLSQALLEAMALGAPVLASRAGGNPELIRPDHTGWLAPPTDPMAWAATIERALADQAARQRVAANARREIRAEFTLPRTAERTEAVYLQALAERRGGARPRASHQDAGPQHHARG